jgi:hypothetical protein
MAHMTARLCAAEAGTRADASKHKAIPCDARSQRADAVFRLTSSTR